ncbi:MAG: hypothetical protein IIY74_02525, partial [Firmicutes bacterium]|nr:hypothetical protein [Bacillota bacterium]
RVGRQGKERKKKILIVLGGGRPKGNTRQLVDAIWENDHRYGLYGRIFLDKSIFAAENMVN